MTDKQTLDANFQIVDPATGKPTFAFLEFLRLNGGYLTQAEDALAELTAAIEGIEIVAGDGLDGGGGLLAGPVTLSVGAGTGITVNPDDVEIDEPAEAERVRDVMGTALVAGNGIAITPDDGGEQITIESLGYGGAFKGALVTKAANQTTADYTTATAIAWDSETYDVGDFHSNSVSNTRFTIPVGVTKVRVSAQADLQNLTADLWAIMTLRKNGATGWVGAGRTTSEIGATAPTIQAHSGIVDVVAGDYFEAFLTVETDTSITVNANGSWFAIEAIETVATQAFDGAIVKKAASETAANYAGGGAVIPWTAEEYDLSGYHDNSTNNSRITIPRAGTYEFMSTVGLDGLTVTSGDYARITLIKNGSPVAFIGGFAQITEISAAAAVVLNGKSGPIVCAAGDYFEVYLLIESDTSITVLASASWFGVKALGFVPNRMGEGTAFPSSPAVNDRFYRTDRRIEYFYDGTRWLSVNLYSAPVSYQSTASLSPITANADMWASHPFFGIYSVYVETFIWSCFNTTTTSTNYLSAQLKQQDAGTLTNLSTLISAQNDTINTWVNHSQAINTVVASTVEAFVVGHAETGTVNAYSIAAFTYRLVG